MIDKEDFCDLFCVVLRSELEHKTIPNDHDLIKVVDDEHEHMFEVLWSSSPSDIMESFDKVLDFDNTFDKIEKEILEDESSAKTFIKGFVETLKDSDIVAFDALTDKAYPLSNIIGWEYVNKKFEDLHKKFS